MIRPYLEDDKNSLLSLFTLNIPQSFAKEEMNDFIYYLDHEIEEYFVVENEKEVIGCGGVNYFPDMNSARISWDIIHPDHQGKGSGRRLLLHRIKLVKETKGIQQLIVRTSQFAYLFYQKSGFELQEIQKDFWSEGFDLYLMKLDL